MVQGGLGWVQGGLRRHKSFWGVQRVFKKSVRVSNVTLKVKGGTNGFRLGKECPRRV